MPEKINPLKNLLISGTLVTLGGCASIGEDGPPLHPIDPFTVQDAIPKFEPVTRAGNPDSYQISGKTYRTLKTNKGYIKQGIASWYGSKFHGRKTANGEIYDMYGVTAAHPTLPIPSYARVTNLENHKTIVVRINDRGPFHDRRIIDLSYAAAMKLDMMAKGTARVEVQAIPIKNPGTNKSAMLSNSSLQHSRTSSRFLQMGAFKERHHAQSLVSRIDDQAGLSAKIFAHQSNDGKIFRVRLGPIHNEEQLRIIENKLGKIGHSDYFIVLEPR